MISTRALYKISEAEIIYYTTRQPVVQSHRLNPQQGIKNTATYSILLPNWNGPEVSNTHANLS